MPINVTELGRYFVWYNDNRYRKDVCGVERLRVQATLGQKSLSLVADREQRSILLR